MAGALLLTLREPADGLDRILVRIRQRLPLPVAGCTGYPVQHDWHRRLHERLGRPWPCEHADAFEALWERMEAELRARGSAPGRASYGGWDDADPQLGLAIWCLIHSMGPERVVETGVAHGLTSRIILEALERAGRGRLWSIDLPAMDPGLHEQIAIAVPERLRARWTYIAGTSRRRLPGLLEQIRPIDLFVHDSSHTRRNTLFELRLAWSALGRGAIVADDINQSTAFAEMSESVGATAVHVALAGDGAALFGILLRGV